MEDKMRKYCSTVPTVEAPSASGLWRIFLGLSLGVQLVTGLVISFVGIYAFTMCNSDKRSDFAGISSLLSIVFCIQVSIAIMMACKLKRTVAVVISVMNFILSSVMLIYETASRKCTQPGEITKDCRMVREYFNACRWMDNEGLDDAEATVEIDNFADGRKTLIAAAAISLASSIATIILIVKAIKAGKPVFLAKRRHKDSIIVGQSRNAEDANLNKLKNIVMTMSRLSEERWFAKKTREHMKEYFSVAKEASNAVAVQSPNVADEAVAKSLRKIPSDKGSPNVSKNSLSRKSSPNTSDKKPNTSDIKKKSLSSPRDSPKTSSKGRRP